ncbi:MAG TPA: YHS domain-containing (seleno)protein [Cyclobacteriaceae bacterium]|nr:YHS domain-containing (seleno)protein [Cyclobacteriaceae bacterium]
MKKIKSVLCITLLILTSTAYAQPGLRVKHFNIEKGVALQGYDPVAYFTQNKAVKGKKEISVTSNDVTYYFSSTANKKLFEGEPQKYEPQFGGWCAYAMGATAEKVEIDPETFKILNGKLYLFYNSFFNNTLPKWNQDEVNLKAKAENNWGKIFK